MADPLSLPSLMLDLRVNDQQLARATGFVVERGDHRYLITNLHVASGRNVETNEVISPTGAVPDTILIWHHSALTEGGVGAWTPREEALYDTAGQPLWIEHPNKDVRDMDNPTEPIADLAALPLTEVDEGVAWWPLDLGLSDADVHVAPGVPVSIIGYPFGRTGPGLFPIWKTGHVASDRDVDWAQRFFLIDATTREGMSGAPVVYRANGINTNCQIDEIIAAGHDRPYTNLALACVTGFDNGHYCIGGSTR
jgi:hypothetical protein